MHKQTKRLLSAIIAVLTILLAAGTALAVPASSSPVWVSDASGIEIQIRSYGDEFFNYSTDMEGRLIVRDAHGFFRYVGESGGVLIALGKAAENDIAGALTAEEISPLRDKLAVLRASLSDPQDSFYTLDGDQDSPDVLSDGYFFTDPKDPLYGRVDYYDKNSFTPPTKLDTCPLLVIRVQFNDVVCLFDEEQWHKRLFEDGISSYYSENSYGKFTYVPAGESCGTPSDGVITVDLPIKRPLYVNKDPGNPNGKGDLESKFFPSTDGNENYAIYNSSSLFAYALVKAESYIDYARYDRNNDSYISPTELAVILVVAGYDASYGGDLVARGRTAVWPHSWIINNLLTETQQNSNTLTVEADGMKLYKYTMMSDNLNWNVVYSDDATKYLRGDQAEYGTACHELGHDLGLPDLYNTGKKKLKYSVGYLSVMANGLDGYIGDKANGSCPVHFDPYCKLELGFAQAQTAQGTGEYELNAANRSDYNILRINTSDPDIYYLAENRQFAGFDRGIAPGYINDANGGVVLWRLNQYVIDNWGPYNELNTEEDAYGVMPVFVSAESSGDLRPFRSSETLALQSGYVIPETNPPLLFSVTDAPSERMRVYLSNVDTGSAHGTEAYIPRNDYNLKSGASIERLPDGAMRVPINAPFDRYTGTAVDGKTLQRGVDYDAEPGSTIITLKPGFLATLKDGEHTLTVYFTDGRFTQSFTTPLSASQTVAAAPELPATGGAPLWVLALLAAAAVLVTVLIIKRKNDK